MKNQIPTDYVERCYAGWLGKLIGIRYGAPIEGWTAEKIREVYGELDGYAFDYPKLFAADDDSNGPMFFIRALEDYSCSEQLTAAEIGRTWLNYAPYEHGFFWWGGYGNSTEHTAYLNLQAGMDAPYSGSIAHNGAAVAEQIGGQIFSDTWGLVAPNQPELAARLAEKAASVSHDGNGIYGGKFVAACVSLAFGKREVRQVMEGALALIPENCEYAHAVRDVMRFYDEQPVKRWREAFEYIKERWGYHRYPGNCHIIPNAAAMILSMLYGENNFDQTLHICNMCGWDTDCNAGNVGAIMGVLCGAENICYSKWAEVFHDVYNLSGVLGCLNHQDISSSALYVAALGYRLAGEKMPARWLEERGEHGLTYRFGLPYATHGFCLLGEGTGMITGKCVQHSKPTPCLKACAAGVVPMQQFRIAKRTYFRAEELYDNRYDPAFTPLVYPGQRLNARVKQPEGSEVTLYASLYALEANSGELLQGERVALPSGCWTELSFTIPRLAHACLSEVGVCVMVGGDIGHGAQDAVVLMEAFTVSGAVCYEIDFAHERMEKFTPFHQEVSQFTRYKGLWRLEGEALTGCSNDEGEVYTGDIAWQDCTLEGDVVCPAVGEAALLVRVQGAMRSYAVTLHKEGLKIQKKNRGMQLLARYDCKLEAGTVHHMRIEARGNTICVLLDGVARLQTQDTQAPYVSGCVGCRVSEGCRGRFSKLRIETYE